MTSQNLEANKQITFSRFHDKIKRNVYKAIIFDVDGTLTEDISWYKITEGLGANRSKHELIFNDLTSGKLQLQQAIDLLTNVWRSTGNANYEYMQKMFESWSLRIDAVSTITELQKRYKICLISGAADLYIESVAGKLGVDEYYANTELKWDSEKNLESFVYYPQQALKKKSNLRYLSGRIIFLKKSALQ